MHKHFVSILHPDDLPRGLELFQRIMNGEKIAPFELRVLSKSGDYLVAEFTITTQTQNGSVINILGIARDVTERQRAEDALRAEKERFRLAAESSTDLIYEWDIKERVDWFGKFDEILGYAPNEFPRTLEQWANSIHPDDRDRVGAAIKNHLEKNEPYDIEYRIKKKDGTYNYWWGRGTSLRDGKGNPYLWIGSVTDITERKRAEEQLRLQSAALEAAANAIIITDCEGVIEWANRAFTSLTGYPFAEVIGRNPRELVKSGEQSQAFYKGLWDTILAGKVWRGQIINHRKDGSLYTEEMTITPLRNERGEGIRFIAIKQDITARKRAEEALRSSEEKYRNILESIEDGYYEVDTAGNFTFFNDSMCRIYGYPREELIGMNNRQYTDQENAKKLFQAFNKVYRTGESTREFDWEIIRKDGTKRYVETSVSLIKDSPGNKIGFRGVVRDITERKRAEEALQRSEEEARRLAQENTVVAEIGRIISSTLDINEVYEAFSAEVKKIIPFDRVVINMIDTEKNTVQNVYMAGKELQDRNVKDIYPLEGSGNAEMVRTKSTLLIQTEDFSEYKDRLPMLLSTFQAGFRSVMNVPLFSKGEIIGGLLLRSQKPYAYTDKEVKLAERIASQIAGAVANAQLYTERIQAEKEREALQEQLRQSQKMEAIGQLAGGVAHDFNNLLTVIKGYSQLSLGETKEGDPLKENIEEIKKAADRAVDLTRQLLAFSRRQIMEMKVLDINTNLQNLEKMLKRIIGEDVELVFLLNKDLGRVRTDPGQIEQVVLNLAVNARDAMPHGGKLTIETDNVKLDEAYAKRHIAVKPGPYVMLSVSDTGVGMTPEVRDRVFEPFFTTKAKGKGTGLGLSTVYGIVKQSGGNIWVYSELGKGTTFKIYLPMVEEILEEVEQMVMKEEPSRGSETILLVEDDEEVRKLAVRILEKRGYRVLKASKGEEALSLCKKQQPIHLMVTDVVMPGMGGRELTNRLKDSHPEMKVLYMSGYTDNAIVHHGVLEKGMNFIQKPFTVDSLTRKVREILDK
jgi:PAS domain S-box-containing protein